MKHILLKILLSFLVFSLGCEEEKETDSDVQIFGGKKAKVNYPWMASLRDVRNRNICGGSLISSKAILTAAHCLVNIADVDNILLGSRTIEGDKESFVIEKSQFENRIVIHPDFRFTMDEKSAAVYDLAIIHLKDKVPEKYEPIRVFGLYEDWDGSDDFEEGTKFWSLGFGLAYDKKKGQKYVPKHLQKVSLPFLSKDKCKSKVYEDKYEGYGKIDKSMLCTYAKSQVKDGCYGDSGGPLVYKDPSDDRKKLVGVTSWGLGCGENPGVWADVRSGNKWIRENLLNPKQTPLNHCEAGEEKFPCTIAEAVDLSSD